MIRSQHQLDLDEIPWPLWIYLICYVKKMFYSHIKYVKIPIAVNAIHNYYVQCLEDDRLVKRYPRKPPYMEGTLLDDAKPMTVVDSSNRNQWKE